MIWTHVVASITAATADGLSKNTRGVIPVSINVSSMEGIHLAASTAIARCATHCESEPLGAVVQFFCRAAFSRANPNIEIGVTTAAANRLREDTVAIVL